MIYTASQKVRYLWMSLLLSLIAAHPVSLLASRPNVLFVIADDLGARLGCYGDPAARTPNVDRLANQGVMFSNCFTQFPSCGPSRFAMFSGRYPFETGMIKNSLHMDPGNSGFISLPRHFREQGYRTARVGKVFHMGIPGGIGEKGDDDSKAWDIAVNNTGWDAIPENYAKATAYVDEPKAATSVTYLDPDIPDAEMADGAGTEIALRIMEEEHPDKTGKPLMLFMGYYRPHPPMIAPRSSWDAIDPETVQLPYYPANDRQDIPEKAFHLLQPGWNFIPEEYGLGYARAYHAAVHFIDNEVGKLLAGLESQGLDKNTIVVFTGDQGFHLGEHGHWHKTTYFDPAFKVPLVIYDPRNPKGEAAEGIVGQIDVYPTLCELAGLDLPNWVSGQSLVPQLRDPSAKGKMVEISQGPYNGFSLRTKRYRYSECTGDGENAMLYDLEKDPGEFTNLVNDPEHADIVRRLKKQLHTRIQKTN